MEHREAAVNGYKFSAALMQDHEALSSGGRQDRVADPFGLLPGVLRKQAVVPAGEIPPNALLGNTHRIDLILLGINIM
jgi:hypothetical protein